MKGLLILFVCLPVYLFSQSVSNTYSVSDIPTNIGSFDPACNGSSTLLTITLPSGGPLQVTGIDIVYNMTAQGGGFKSHQRSQMHCQTTNTTESTVFAGSGDVSGIQSYSRSNVSIANGTYPGGTNIIFEMHAWRTSQGSGCNTTFNKVDNFTWMITVHYSAIPVDGSVGIGTISPNTSALLDLSSVQKGFLMPRMTKELRNAIPSPAEGLLVYCTNCLPASLYQYKGTVWTRISGLTLEDADGDTKIMVEKNPDEDKIRFDLGGTEFYVMNGPRLEVKNSGQSVFIGENAGANDNLNNNGNVFIGFNSGQNNTIGDQNTAIGRKALYSNTGGEGNTAIGSFTLFSNTTGGNNTAVGKEALSGNTIGGDNTALGASALNFNLGGIKNTAIGSFALNSNRSGNNNTATGTSALISNDTGSENTASGVSALFLNISGSNNTAMGMEALFSNTAGNTNTASGASALFNNTIGTDNTAIGGSSLFSNTTGNENTAAGVNALFSNTTGSLNTASGYSALNSNTTGNRNVADGRKSLFSNTTGNDNVALGYTALFSNTTSSNNTAVGMEALFSNTTGTANTATGRTSLRNNSTGGNNTAVGMEALFSNTNGNQNSAIGKSALFSNTTAGQNTAIGNGALFTQSFSNGGAVWNAKNVAIGIEALFSNQPTLITNGNENTAIGAFALHQNTTGFDNTAIGNNALFDNTTGEFNTAVGSFALSDNTTGGANTGVGLGALFTNTSGHNNTSVGQNSMAFNTTGIFNTASGTSALFDNITGNQNTAIGGNSLGSNTSGSNNTAIGYDAAEAANYNESTFIGASINITTNRTNVSVLGYNIQNGQCTADNQVLLGNTAVGQIRAQVTSITAYSDRRFKSNITENVPGLEFIKRLKPVTYNENPEILHQIWGTPDSVIAKMDHTDIKNQRFIGFVAQDVEQAANEIGFEFPGIDIPKSDKEVYSLRYVDFIMPMVKSIQEQQEMITDLVNQNEQLKQNYQELKALVELQNKMIEKINPLPPASNQE